MDRTYYGIIDALMAHHVGDGAGTIMPWRVVRVYTCHVLIRMTVCMLALLNSISAILHFLPERLAQAGFNIPLALFFSACCALVYLLAPLPAILFINQLGRRWFLMVGSGALTEALTIIVWLQVYADRWPRMLTYLGGTRRVGPGQHRCSSGAALGERWVTSWGMRRVIHTRKGMGPCTQWLPHERTLMRPHVIHFSFDKFNSVSHIIYWKPLRPKLESIHSRELGGKANESHLLSS
jgi:hypothetical protein